MNGPGGRAVVELNGLTCGSCKEHITTNEESDGHIPPNIIDECGVLKCCGTAVVSVVAVTSALSVPVLLVIVVEGDHLGGTKGEHNVSGTVVGAVIEVHSGSNS